MPIISYNNISGIGMANDPIPSTLPADEKNGFAWSNVQNMRFKDGSITKMPGYETLINPSVAPYFSSRLQYNGNTYYIYAGLNKIYCQYAGAQYEITRSSSEYNADKDHPWNMDVLNGYPILNNGMDLPQAWLNIAHTQRLVNLPYWDTTKTAKIIRSYKAYLIALDVSTTTSRNQNLIKWSAAALPGQLPTSWDIADPTNDAGEISISDSDGYLVDCLLLNDFNIVYKNTSTYVMSYVGGNEIFSLKQIFPKVGMLAPNCAAFFEGKHFVVTTDDVIVHDGFQYQSVIDGKNRKYLFKSLNANSVQRTFVVPNYENSEMWICYSTGGSTYPNACLIFNYKTGSWSRRVLPETSHIDHGFIDIPDQVLWQDANYTWKSQNTIWDSTKFNKIAWSLSMCVPSDTKIYLLDKEGTLNDNGNSVTAFVERINFQIYDDQHMKFIKRLWPKVTKKAGANSFIQVYVGTSLTTTGQPVWQGPYQFNTLLDDKLDCLCFGRYISVRFETTSDLVWELHGFDLEVDSKGKW